MQGKENLNSTGGNYFCGLVLSTWIAMFPKNFQMRRNDAFSDREILMAQIGLLCNGRTDFNDIDLYKNDTLFTEAFGLHAIPSEPVFRTRLDEMPAERTHQAIRDLNIQLLRERSFGRVDADGLKLIPVDVDVTPLDNSGSNKQGVSWTYKKHPGFAPIMSYIGTEGYMLDCELRPGKQHCQSGTPDFLRRSVRQIDFLGYTGKCLFRLDSGNDAADNFECFGDNYYIIKRNLRKESLEQWLAMARRVGIKQKTREGKNLYVGFVDHLIPGGNKEKQAVSVAFEVLERVTDPDGQLLLIPEIEVNTWWTNLPCQAETVVSLYHDHGTSEQFHSELKSDLDVEQLPSGKLCVNKIIFLCAMVAFNVLRTIGQETIKNASLAPQKINVKRWRLKTVLQNIIYSAVRICRHARRVELHFGRHSPWFNVMEKLAHSFT